MKDSLFVPSVTWVHSFLAQAQEVGALRALVATQVELWGVPEVNDTARLCVSELVANVITHVGEATPATLTLTLSGSRLRITVRDPDARALPTLVQAHGDDEGGRGMALVSALASRWGVDLPGDGKVTWCELAVGTAVLGNAPSSAGRRARVARMLTAYNDESVLVGAQQSRLGKATAEVTVVQVISDLLHWLRAHGHDADDILDRAQTRFEAERGAAGLPW
ncbi:ATP-binding protein [Streptomyces longwoodensis]|uniref:ATP-binding protein n=1 Tax=Streptomyces longwoodensis TaxID=68231 RepID=UPI00340CA625